MNRQTKKRKPNKYILPALLLIAAFCAAAFAVSPQLRTEAGRLFTNIGDSVAAWSGQEPEDSSATPSPSSGISTPTPSPEDTPVPGYDEALAVLLAEISDNYYPGTAGSSLVSAKYAAQLLDWQAEVKPDDTVIHTTGEAAYAALSADASSEFPAKLDDIYYAALQLMADNAEALLSDAGYTPEAYPWAEADMQRLFKVLYAAIGAKLPELPQLSEEEVRAIALLADMTLEAKTAQLFFVSCHDYNASANAINSAIKAGAGGLVLFGKDFTGKSSAEVAAMTEAYQRNAEVPLLIAVDEEGGTVNRVSTNKNLRAVPFWSPQALYAEGGFDLVKSDTEEKCALLKTLGINVNLAPVCDVSTDSKNYIYARTFGKDAAATADYVSAVVNTMQQSGVGAVLKHFPGYGNNENTHAGAAYDDRPYSVFTESDFLPFIAGIEAGADAVLVSHNTVACMDAERPASLSPEVHRILREELGFDGVIMTDDLFMEAVSAYTDSANAAVEALLSGNDMLCSADFAGQYAAVLAAAKDGRISEERIDESVLRILRWKLKIGILS